MDHHFKVLGLLRSQRRKGDVKAAYHRLARGNHPDKVGPEGTERMKEINTAYETIMELNLYDKEDEDAAIPVSTYWPGVYAPHQPNRDGLFKTKLVLKRRPKPKMLQKRPDAIAETGSED